MNNESKPNFYEFIFGLTIILILFCGVINIGISKINKVYAAKYCKYNSSSKICQELAKNCTIDQLACMNKTNDIIPIELLNNLSYIQICKMADKVKKIEKENIKNTKTIEKKTKKEIYSIEIE